MEEEVKVVVRVWFVAIPAAMSYCYFLNSIIRPGKWRLLAILPVIALFILLPFSFSTVHIRFITAGIFVWLAPFKLLLFAFDRGPLRNGGTTDQRSLLTFILLASLPILIKKNPASPQTSRPLKIFITGYAMKGLLLAFIVYFYPERRRFHRGMAFALHFLYSYMLIDLFAASTAVVARALLPPGTGLEPQFAAPFLSSSLQDFWARRWNLVISGLLRSAVYDPVRSLYGRTAGVMASFIVSALMHEVLFYYLAVEPSSGEVGLFFVLHGVCTAAEISVKKWWSRRGMKPLHPVLTIPVTVVFVLGSSWWLFMPPAIRAFEKETEDFLSLLKGFVMRHDVR